MVSRRVLVLMLLVLSGCSSFGPGKVSVTRIDYNAAVQTSNNEEMLLNMVRVKYFEQPLFVQVGSISSSFNYNLSVGASAGIPDQRDFVNKVFTTYTPTFTGQYTDAPTITYTPFQGNSYIQQFLSELDFERFAILAKSGWDLEYLLNILVMHIGNIEHQLDLRAGYIPEHDAKFRALVALLKKIDDRNDVEFLTFSTGKDKPNVTVMTIAFEDEAESQRLSELLGVDVHAERSRHGRLVSKLRLVPRNGTIIEDDELKKYTALPLRLRNCFRAMVVMSQGIEVPREKIKTGEGFDLRNAFQNLCNVKSSPNRPGNAFVAVQYKGYWYFIDNTDSRSKETFQVLLNIFALQSGDPPKNGPLLTLPVGAQ